MDQMTERLAALKAAWFDAEMNARTQLQLRDQIFAEIQQIVNQLNSRQAVEQPGTAEAQQ